MQREVTQALINLKTTVSVKRSPPSAIEARSSTVDNRLSRLSQAD
jgi:hypothetical protein